MNARSRLTRLVVVAVTAAGLTVGTGTAVADPSANALEQRADNAGGANAGVNRSDNPGGGNGADNAGGANGDEYRSDNAPGGEVTGVDEHRPAGAGQGRKIG